MSLANGHPYVAIPGPSVMPEEVLRAMHRGSPNIYEGALPATMASLVPDLRYVAQTEGHVAMYISNGHGAWEAALVNILAPGDRVLVPACGRFGFGWADVATGLGAEVEILDHGRSSPIDAERVRAALAADPEHKIKAVLAVHVDTSSSVRSDIPALRAVLDELGHPALLMLDCVASLGCDEIRMDAWGVDVLVSASQKGLMVPPGMALVFFNDKAAEVRRSLSNVSRYWDWEPRAFPEFPYNYFGGTAPTNHIYGMRAALDLIRAEGIEAIWARHALLAKAVWTAVEVWGSEGPLRLNISEPSQRSHAVTSLAIGAPHGQRLRTWCEDQAGVTLGIGLGMSDEDDPHGTGYFRFGHMGHVNAHMIMGLLGVVEAGLMALDIPHGKGGVSAAAAVLAGA